MNFRKDEKKAFHSELKRLGMFDIHKKAKRLAKEYRDTFKIEQTFVRNLKGSAISSYKKVGTPISTIVIGEPSNKIKKRNKNRRKRMKRQFNKQFTVKKLGSETVIKQTSKKDFFVNGKFDSKGFDVSKIYAKALTFYERDIKRLGVKGFEQRWKNKELYIKSKMIYLRDRALKALETAERLEKQKARKAKKAALKAMIAVATTVLPLKSKKGSSDPNKPFESVLDVLPEKTFKTTQKAQNVPKTPIYAFKPRIQNENGTMSERLTLLFGTCL